MAKIAQIALRALQWVWTILIMSLIGNMIHEAFAGNPSSVNYTMFVAAFSAFSLIYLTLVAFNDGFSGHPVLPLVLDVLNTIFFFCGAVVLAAKLHVHSCNNLAYITTNSITNGSFNMSKRCREAQASTAFLWFGFACYFASMVLSIVGARGGANMRIGGIRKGGPSMSQV